MGGEHKYLREEPIDQETSAGLSMTERNERQSTHGHAEELGASNPTNLSYVSLERKRESPKWRKAWSRV